MASIMLRRFRLGISVVCAKVMFVLGLERFPNLRRLRSLLEESLYAPI